MATISNINFAIAITQNPYATEARKNATYYYNTQGDATAEYFLTANVGTVTLSNGFGNINLVANLDALGPAESKAFSIIVRKDSVSGTVVATSNTINILGEDTLFHQASGGNTVVTGGYKIHEFRSSGNLIVTSVAAPLNNQVDYFIVAGGGGGAGEVGAGGGAGGMLTGTGSSSVITSAGNLLILVGAGGNKTTTGSSGYPPSTIGSRGGNSQIGSFIAIGGGLGRTYQNRTDISPTLVDGGSGGGGWNPGPPSFSFGVGTPGQGNPGGGIAPSGFGGGGGGASQPGNQPALPASGRKGGDGAAVTWGTPFVGTPGPTSGRWFSGGGGGGHNNDSGPPFGGEGGAGGGGPGLIRFTPSDTQGAIYTGGGGGGAVPNSGGNGGSGAVGIRYPFKPAPTYTITVSASNMISNSSVTYAIVTTGLTANARFYYTLTGSATSADINTPLSGSFIVSNNRANLQIVSNAAATIGRTFRLQMRRLSTTGKVLATGNVITIDPITYIQATGGTITNSAGYRTHAFTSSNTFSVTTLSNNPAFNTIDYLIVAGGGGGGTSLEGQGAGGGGAGGLRTGNTAVTVQNYSLVVGGGGRALGVDGAPYSGTPGVSENGSNSTGFGLTSLGGGGGGGYQDRAGAPGGSGGGGCSGGGGAPGGTGSPGQGNPGGGNGGAPAGYNSGGGGGAGAAGTSSTAGTAAAFPSGTPGGIGLPITWVPTSYGTVGPAPGRYFAGGGGGGQRNSAPPSFPGQENRGGFGGAGGGGMGGSVPNAANASVAGSVNTGGGGGGANGYGNNGGSGIILVRYPYQ